MVNLLLDVKDNFDMFFGMGWFLPLFLIGILFLLLNGERKKGWLFAGGSILILVASFFIPCIYVIKKCIGMNVYWRFYWLLPLNIVIAYFLTEMLPKKEDSFRFKIIYSLIILLFFVFGGTNIISQKNFSKSQNEYELSADAVGLADIILEQAGEDEEIMAIFPPQYVTDVRQYSAKIHMAYGRKQLSRNGRKARFFYGLGLCKKSYAGVVRAANRGKYNYIIYIRDASSDTYLNEKGFTCIGVSGDYGVYKRINS